MFRYTSHALRSFRALATALPLVLGISYLAEAAPPDQTSFQIVINPQFARCLAANPYIEPKANVLVQRGELNDTLTIALSGFKPGLAFDMFTVEKSPFKANGQPDPNFKGIFGLAWYQSDLKAAANPNQISIKTILLDQIFGFDPLVNLKPTNTFHVGFWFNNPADAAPCGFDVKKFTPFNGEHRAGPVAAISKPIANTGLGPLCTNPNFSTQPTSCKP